MILLLTDVAGKTVKTKRFNVPQTLKNAKLYIITSSHGANAGGEEYNRRDHFVFFDKEQVLKYKPGGESCEPFRQYNTQRNFIYLFSEKSASWWALWNNWCPGDKIPVRTVDLGDLESGIHKFKISVPHAEFKDSKGDIPLTVYLQGEKDDAE